MDLLIATNNPGKMEEYRQIFKSLPLRLLSLDDVGIAMDVEETGLTFHENATIKARAYAEMSGHLTLADDSGLCVEALGGGPGIYSARYGGPGLDDAGRRRKLVEEMAAVPDGERGAHFECIIALLDPSTGGIVTVRGIVHGHIAREESDGPHGFGYDPVFIPRGLQCTFADLTADQKDRISHRGRAAKKLVHVLQEMLEARAGA